MMSIGIVPTISCDTFNKWWFEVSLNLRNLSCRQRNLLLNINMKYTIKENCKQ
jgi:hypothetical protein